MMFVHNPNETKKKPTCDKEMSALNISRKIDLKKEAKTKNGI